MTRRLVRPEEAPAAPRLRVVAYIRVSTEEQAREGLSLPAQRSRVEAFVTFREAELVAVEVDDGYTAKRMGKHRSRRWRDQVDRKRPALGRAFRLLEDGAADALLVTRLDRLTRSAHDWYEMSDRYFGEQAPYKLMSVNEQVDTSTANGRLMLAMHINIAQWESETIGERTKEGMRMLREQGRYTGGRVPFGYELDEERQLRVNPGEVAIAVRARELRAEGLSTRAIGRRLFEEGHAPRGGAPWAPATIVRLLRAPSDTPE